MQYTMSELTGKKEIKNEEDDSVKSKHLKHNFSNYLILAISILLIGYLSPTGVLRASLTGIFMYLYTFSIHCSGSAFKPLADFLTKAGTTRLLNSELLSFLCAFGWMIWLLICNYVFHRFTGITVLDNFIVIFWIMVYMSIHVVNFMIMKKSENGGRELTELLNIVTNKHQSKEVTSMGEPKLNIIISASCIVAVLLVLKNYPEIVSVPESYLKSAEDTIFKMIFPNTNISRHGTRL